MRALILLCSLLVSGVVAHAQGAAPAFRAGQYNSSLPSFASGATGYLQMDANGRLILAPSTSINVGSITGSVVLPTGASTSANQQTEITALQGLSNRASYGYDYSSSIAANGGSFAGQSYTAGTAYSGTPARGVSAYTRFTVQFVPSQGGVGYLEGSNDNSSFNVIQQVNLSAGTNPTLTTNIFYPYLRGRATNTSTGTGAMLIQGSLTVN